MARSRTNDLSQLVNNFFYIDSPSPVNYGFKRVDGVHLGQPTEEKKKLIRHNRKTAEKLMKDLSFMNNKQVNNPSTRLV
jgi:hypothetical protein